MDTYMYEQVRYTLGLIKSHEPAISSPPAPTPHWTLHLTLRFTWTFTYITSHDDGWPHDGLPVSCVPCVLHPHPWNRLVAIGNAVCCAELSGRPTRSIERARRPAISVSASLSLAVSSPPLSSRAHSGDSRCPPRSRAGLADRSGIALEVADSRASMHLMSSCSHSIPHAQLHPAQTPLPL